MKVLITGASGQLGRELMLVLGGQVQTDHGIGKNTSDSKHEVFGCSSSELDVRDLQQCREVVKVVRPDVIIHTAAYTAVDRAENDQENAFAVNELGSRNVAIAAEEFKAKLIYLSTDYVFDGMADRPYKEEDITNPLTVYGKSKLAGEKAVQETVSRLFIVRTSWVFGRFGNNFVKTMLRLGKERELLKVVDDQVGSPTYTVDLCHFLNELMDSDRYGIYHVSNTGSCTWYEFACTIFTLCGYKTVVVPCATADFPRDAPRPQYSVMAHDALRDNHFTDMRDWRAALREFLQELQGEISLKTPGSSEGEKEQTVPGLSEGEKKQTIPGLSEGEKEQTVPGSSEGEEEQTIPGLSEGEKEQTVPGLSEGEKEQTVPGSSEPVTVSVHIVTYNSAKHVDACLQAVYKQSFPLAQVIIVDNASTDMTRGVLKPYAERALIVFNAQNRGFAAAHNQALELTNSDYCLVLNPDVILQPDYVACLVAAMGRDKRIGSATGRLLRQSDHSLVDSMGIEMNKFRRATDRKAGDHIGTQHNRNEDNINKVFGVSGAAAMYSRTMVMDILLDGQFFDEAFFAYKEDVDVAWRAQLYGWSAIYVPVAVAYHERGWKTGMRIKQPKFVRRHSYINRYRMILKNDRMFYILRDTMQLFAFELAGFAYLLVREPTLLVAWRGLFHDLPHILHQRSEIRRKTKVKLKQVYLFFTANS